MINPFEMLKNLNIEEIRKKSMEMNEELKTLTATGESGGGFVRVTINGDFNILSVDYEDGGMLKDDIPAFRDLVIAAHNIAVEKMKEEIKRKFSANIVPGLFG